jgi:ethanolamine ammonia-lyase small subunit
MTLHPDPWLPLRRATPARIGLGRSGHSLPTAAVLAFAADHAAARDAVYEELDTDLLTTQLGRPSRIVDSAAPDRATYLQRPDLGRTLSAQSRSTLRSDRHDVTFVLADGLSARAVHEHGVALLDGTLAHLGDVTVGTPVLARQARVALGDEIALLTGARLVVMLIGERPGLSAANSLSAYTTYAPRPGPADSRRNCISNIRQGAGLPVASASVQLGRLIRASLTQQIPGIELHLEPKRSTSGSLDIEHGQRPDITATSDTGTAAVDPGGSGAR